MSIFRLTHSEKLPFNFSQEKLGAQISEVIKFRIIILNLQMFTSLYVVHHKFNYVGLWTNQFLLVIATVL